MRWAAESNVNWEAIGAVGELLGSAAVFVTLGYLAIQVRHARAEASRALSQGRMEANRELISLDLEEQNLAARLKAEIAFEVRPTPIVDLLAEQGKLTQEEASRVFLVEVAAWNYRIHVIAHWSDLPASEKAIFDEAIRVRMASDLTRLMYEKHFKAGFHPDVVKYLEKTLSETRAKPPDNGL
jgi:hypothetical protein